jgi:F420-0:gamma-glutamyl ligase-like protein
VLQHLLLGINAHISLDLGIAAATVAPGSSIATIKNDFDKINAILASQVDTVEVQLAGIFPLLKPIDRLAGRLDEEFACFSVNIARDAAWQMALHLASLTNETEKENFIRERDKAVSSFAMKLYRPGIIINGLITLFRVGEIGTVRSKIEWLSR